MASQAQPARYDMRPDAADVERWLTDYQRDRDVELRDWIATQHEWLVSICVHQMGGRGEAFDDLAQVARIGLLNAIDRFDPEFGVAFRTFASATMTGLLRRQSRASWRLRVPRRVQELTALVRGAVEDLSTRLQRPPTVAELATFLEIDETDVLDALHAGLNYRPLSLAALQTAPGESGHDDVLGLVDGGFELTEARAHLRSLLARLPERQQTILYLTYFNDLRQEDIAAILGISQVHVSRLLRSALDQARRASTPHD